MLEWKIVEVGGLRPAIEGMRFAYKSWNNASYENDIKRVNALNQYGNPHNKYLRQMFVWVIIKADFIFWKQFDTYRMGKEQNSASTMHTVMQKPFEPSDFGLSEKEALDPWWIETIGELNRIRQAYLDEKDPEIKKKLEWELLRKMPMSYIQERMCCLSYAVLQKMFEERKEHKNPDWFRFLEITHALPLGELIRKEPFEVDECLVMDYESFFERTAADFAEEYPVYTAYGTQPIYPMISKMKEAMDALLFDENELFQDNFIIGLVNDTANAFRRRMKHFLKEKNDQPEEESSE